MPEETMPEETMPEETMPDARTPEKTKPEQAARLDLRPDTDMGVTFGCVTLGFHQAATPQQVGGSLSQILKVCPLRALPGYE